MSPRNEQGFERARTEIITDSTSTIVKHHRKRKESIGDEQETNDLAGKQNKIKTDGSPSNK